MLTLYVLRHGKAVKPGESTDDFKRKLNKKGTAQANQIGYIFQFNEFVVDQIIASGAQRTQETAEIMNYYLWRKPIIFDDSLYLASREKIQAVLQEKANGKNILLTGHNFGLSDFVNYLVNDQLVMSTALLVQINFNFDDWKLLGANTGTIEKIIEPQVHSF
ncbi:MAG: phosphohistidine phosphatase [Crocinitomix sp.]|jgi:phosphohistidine phosphatase